MIHIVYSGAWDGQVTHIKIYLQQCLSNHIGAPKVATALYRIKTSSSPSQVTKIFGPASQYVCVT